MDSFFAEGKSVSRFCSHLVTLVVDDHACLLSPRPGGGMPMGPPQGPPAPPSRPVNAFANIDSRIAFLVSLLMPTLSSSAVAAIASNRTVKA